MRRRGSSARGGFCKTAPQPSFRPFCPRPRGGSSPRSHGAHAGAKLAGISVLTAAAGAVAVLVRNRRKLGVTTAAAGSDAGNVAPAAEMGDGPAMASTDAEADVSGQVRTS